MQIKRTGQRPLEFEGDEIASESSRNHAGRERNRWHEIAVYRTATGKHVVSVSYRTRWEGESEHHDAVVFDSREQVGTLLEEYIFPNIASIGFPASAAYAERQAKLIADIEEGFRHAASRILTQIGCAEKI